MARGYKPPYSYIVLIGMAIRDRGGKANVGDIYDFITRTFPYFRTANPVCQWLINMTLDAHRLHCTELAQQHPPQSIPQQELHEGESATMVGMLSSEFSHSGR